MQRWPLYLDAATRANLDLKAAAHGVSRPEYVRALINGTRPGSEPGTPAALADRWWDTRSPVRRVSIWRNHASRIEDSMADRAALDQLTIDDALGTGDRP